MNEARVRVEASSTTLRIDLPVWPRVRAHAVWIGLCLLWPAVGLAVAARLGWDLSRAAIVALGPSAGLLVAGVRPLVTAVSAKPLVLTRHASAIAVGATHSFDPDAFTVSLVDRVRPLGRRDHVVSLMVQTRVREAVLQLRVFECALDDAALAREVAEKLERFIRGVRVSSLEP